MRFDTLPSRAAVVTPSLLLLAALLLSACGNPVRALGLQKEAPDEFAVVARAPLSLPPDFTLRPPRPGAARPNEVTPREEARAAVFKVEARTPENQVLNQTPGGPLASPRGRVVSVTLGEEAVLGRAGANDVQADIRTLVDRESAVLASTDDGFIDRLLSFRDANGGGAVLVDAAAEAKRLKQKQALGLPVTDGETPRIERKKRTFLDLF
ncbi:MAG: DUF3035 domain-containing protein [Alphaproteobacteria bacterium]